MQVNGLPVDDTLQSLSKLFERHPSIPCWLANITIPVLYEKSMGARITENFYKHVMWPPIYISPSLSLVIEACNRCDTLCPLYYFMTLFAWYYFCNFAMVVVHLIASTKTWCALFGGLRWKWLVSSGLCNPVGKVLYRPACIGAIQRLNIPEPLVVFIDAVAPTDPCRPELTSQSGLTLDTQFSMESSIKFTNALCRHEGLDQQLNPIWFL